MEYRLKDISWYKVEGQGFFPYITNSQNNKFKIITTGKIYEYSDAGDFAKKIAAAVGECGETSNGYLVLYNYYRNYDPIEVLFNYGILSQDEYQTKIVNDFQIKRITKNINKHYTKELQKNKTIAEKSKLKKAKEEKQEEKRIEISENSREF